jgi:ribosomal protein S27AE
MDDIDVNDGEGLLIHKGKFIEKNKDAERVQEKTCKRCGTRLTIYEDDIGTFRLWCMQCETVQKSFA